MMGVVPRQLWRWLTLGLAVAPIAAPGAERGYVAELVERAREARLADRPEWRALLHYERDPVGAGVTSLIDSPAFFRAPDGKTDPQAELEATIAAFFAPASGQDAEESPQCAMIARYRWLKAELSFDPARLREDRCRDFREWYRRIDPAQITLIFPAAYLNNPSSMFGHTLLRLDRPNQDESTRLLSYAVNFGAETGADGGLAFAVRGLTGAYRGTFSVMPYYEMVKRYSDIENRDIWEYQLNFTREETARVVEHLWELRNHHIDYYFFTTNCSYALLSLLDVARPELDLTEGFTFHTMPVDTVRAVMKHPSLLRRTTFRPSQRTRLEQDWRELRREERQLALRLARGEIEPDEAALARSGAVSRARTIELAQGYLQYQLDTDTKARAQIANRSLKLLHARAKLAVDSTPGARGEPHARPDQGHGSGRAAVGIGATEGRSFVELRARPAYHGLVDPGAGFAAGAAIDFLDLRLRWYEGRSPHLESLSIIDIRSLTPRNEMFQPISWQVRARLDRFRRDGRDLGKLVFTAGGGAGFTWSPGDGALLYGLADAALFADGDWPDGRLFGIGPVAGVVWPITRRWTLGVEGRWQLVLGGETDERFSFGLKQSFALTRNLAVRAGAAIRNDGEETYNEISLSLQWYF